MTYHTRLIVIKRLGYYKNVKKNKLIFKLFNCPILLLKKQSW